MIREQKGPRVFRILCEDALEINHTPFGSVGKVFSGQGIEAVWVSKQDEAIDPEWFSQPMVDLIVVLQGQLRVEFEQEDLAPLVLDPGDLLVLPPDTRCRAYRWPRERKEATVFLAVYPVEQT
jgi:quercetin dioxygenase-like cupin family protein